MRAVMEGVCPACGLKGRHMPSCPALKHDPFYPNGNAAAYSQHGRSKGLQTTIDGPDIAEPIPAPPEKHAQDRLFTADPQIAGQINLETDGSET